MKPEPNRDIEPFRRVHPLFGESEAGKNYGFFILPGRRYDLYVILSDGRGWDHASVSRNDKVMPSWSDMCRVKDLFFLPEETVVQFHPKRSEYVNICEVCLHLWRRQGQEYELPPKDMVA